MASRLLIVSPTDSRSGAGLFRHALAMGLRRAGYEVILAQPAENGPIQAAEIAHGIEHHFFSRNPYDGITEFAHDSALAVAEVQRTAPDFVVFSSGVSPECHYSFLEAVDQAGIPYLLIEHQAGPQWFAANPNTISRFAAWYRNASAVVAVSDNNLRHIRQSLGLPDRIGTVIRNGRPDTFFRPRDPARRAMLRQLWGVPDDALVALTVAKLEPVKGHRYLIEAMRRLQSEPIWQRLYFVWIGDGVYRAELERELAQAGVSERVRLAGHHLDVAPLYDGGDVFVLTSTFEGMPLSVMEAMAKGLPPICTDVGGTAEAIGHAGVVLPAPSEDGAAVAGLATALSVFAGDRDRLPFLATAARRRAAALFREDRMIEEYCDLIAGGLNTGRPVPRPAPASSFPDGDYVAPGLAGIRLDKGFPNMIVGDKTTSKWPYLRRNIPHNWYVDRRHPAVGFVSRDEAHILFNTGLRFRGQRALEIGCWLGWSAAHLAAAGVDLDVIDPLLATPDIYASVLASMRRTGLGERVRLLPGSSPDKVFELCGIMQRRWSLIFIDGNHERPHPELDAKAAALVAEDDAVILLHDLVAPDVAAGLDFLRSRGWNTMLYQTMQIMGIAWRGRVEPIAHVPDPRVDWTLPDHLRSYRVSGVG